MSKLVNIEGIELEQCVIDNEELDYVTTIPEDVQFINEYIESEMDKQPDNIEEDVHIQNLMIDQELEVFPSCLNIEEYFDKELTTWYQDKLIEYDTIIQDIQADKQNFIEQCKVTISRNYYTNYLKDYNKSLREWYFNKHPQYVRK
jgi:hypothetical protein